VVIDEVWAVRNGPHEWRTADPLGFARDDKKERAVERRGPLPRAIAVAGAVATPISSPLLRELTKVTGAQDDDFVRVRRNMMAIR
jgi:hypothetical protein